MNTDETGSKIVDDCQEPVSNRPETQSSAAPSPQDHSGQTLDKRAASDRQAATSKASSIGAGEQTRQVEGATTDPENQSGRASKAQIAGEQTATITAMTSHPVGFIRQYELVERVKAYDPHCDEDLINRAYVFSMKAHGGQTRKSGDPYFTHPISVAAILTELKADPETIITALLHDTVEDTTATVEEIESLFGKRVAVLVDGVTKLSKFELKTDASKEAENFRKFVLAMSQDVRVLLVKLADRLHNMRTLHYIDKPEKRHRIALETMQIYVPLSGRIGVQKFREELEDLSFKYMNPDGYKTIKDNLERLGKETVRSVVLLGQALRQHLAENNVKAEVYSREKRAFSIWRKMQRKGHAFEELADIYAFRIIVETVEDCYRSLGIIHQNFPMIPGEFDDYVSTPKPNNYRSIHTAVLAPIDATGIRQRVEIQIRTKEMHETAERGIAAHWRYKDVSAHAEKSRVIEIANAGEYDPYDWARNAVEMLQHGDTADEFLENAKLDLFQDQVFCFTPKGRVIALPAGATPIDFAYALHTDIGESCVGARINGVTRPLRTPLRNGDIVHVLRSESAPIPQNWETMTVTGRARSSIRRRIKQLKKQEQVKLGKRILESEFQAHGLALSDSAIESASPRLDGSSSEDVYEKVGSLRLQARAVRLAVYPGSDTPDNNERAGLVTEEQPLREAISLEGLTKGVSISLAPCCTPLPGERIVGLPDSTGLVLIHRIDCDALATTSVSEEKWLDLRWRTDMEGGFIAPITITVNNRIGALAHVSSILARYEVDIVDIRLVNREIEFNEILMDVLIRDVRHLSNVLTGLRASEHVLGADRRYDETTKRKAGTKNDATG